MKKRILSLVLAVLMVATALPLLMLPSFAASAPEYEPEDYDALYVQEGLKFAFDFFTTNKYWGGSPVTISAGTAAVTDLNKFVTYPATKTGFGGAQAARAESVVKDGYYQMTEHSHLNWNDQLSHTGVNGEGVGATVEILSELLTPSNGTHGYTFAFWLDGMRFYVTQSGSKDNYKLDVRYIGLVANDKITSSSTLDGNPKEGTLFPLAANQLVARTLYYKRPTLDGSIKNFTYSADIYKPEGTIDATTFVVTHEAEYEGDVLLGVKAVVKESKIYSDYEPVFEKTNKVWDEDAGEYVETAEALTYIVGANMRGTKDENGNIVNNYGPNGAPYYHTDKTTIEYYENGTLVYGKEVATPNNSSIFSGTYWHWGAAVATKVYAERHYKGELTDDQKAVNHLADLCKWFRLDITKYARLSELDRVVVAKQFSGYTFASDDDRDEMQALLDAEADKLIYDVLLAGETAGTPAYEALVAFVNTAKSYDLDVSALKMLPAEFRGGVYNAVNGYIGVKTAENLQRAIDDAIASTIDLYYGQYVDETEYDYRDYYVRQDELYTAIDFFDAKKTDAPVYASKAYPDWQKLYNDYMANIELEEDWVKKKDGSYVRAKGYTMQTGDTLVPMYKADKADEKNKLAKWQMQGWTLADGKPITAVADARNYIRDNLRTVEEHESNWSEVLDKYLWKGEKSELRLLDITDAYYVHDNIREFGDGTLICGTNDSLTVDFKDMTSPVSYQIVSKASGSSEWQLSGFRFGVVASGTTVKVDKFSHNGYAVGGTEAKPKPNRIELLNITTGMAAVDQTYSSDITAVANLRTGAAPGFYYDFRWDGTKYEVRQGDSKLTAEEEAEGWQNSGSMAYTGLMDLTAYVNGKKSAERKDLTFNATNIGSVGNGGAYTYYAIRVYSCTLTEDDIRQNHFADIAGYYDLDLGMYERLDEEEKLALQKQLLSIQLGTPRDTVTDLFESFIRENYYNLPAVSGDAADKAEVFRTMAQDYRLKVESLLELSVMAQESIYTYFTSDAVAGVSWHPAILQNELETMVAAMRDDYYAKSFVHSVATFEGIQLTKSGDIAMRSLFTLNTAIIDNISALYSADELTFQVGVVLLAEGDAAERVTVENGDVVLPASAKASVIAYEGGDYTDSTFLYKDKLSFALEYAPEVPEEGDPDVKEELVFLAYVVVASEDEEIVYTIDTTTEAQKGNGVSIFELTEYAKKDLNFAYENVQNIMNSVSEEDYGDIVLSVGTNNICDYRVVVTEENAALVAALQALIEDYVGIKLFEITAADAAKYDNVLYVGLDCDVVHYGDALYGLSALGNDMSIWYHDAANSEAALDIFEDILDYARNDNEKYTIALGTDIVYRARTAAAE